MDLQTLNHREGVKELEIWGIDEGGIRVLIHDYSEQERQPECIADFTLSAEDTQLLVDFIKVRKNNETNQTP